MSFSFTEQYVTSPRTIHVDSARANLAVPADGTPERPYKTITEALAVIPNITLADLSADADAALAKLHTIVLASGKHENIIINKSCIVQGMCGTFVQNFTCTNDAFIFLLSNLILQGDVNIYPEGMLRLNNVTIDNFEDEEAISIILVPVADVVNCVMGHISFRIDDLELSACKIIELGLIDLSGEIYAGIHYSYIHELVLGKSYDFIEGEIDLNYTKITEGLDVGSDYLVTAYASVLTEGEVEGTLEAVGIYASEEE